MRRILNPISCLLVPLSPCLLGSPARAGIDEHLDAVCRITAGNTMGTGCVFHVGQQYTYILTNNHVVTGHDQVGIDFWSSGYQSNRVQGQVLVADPSIDAAAVLVPTAVFGERPPKAIPLGDSGDSPAIGAVVASAGCPGGAWPSAWKGHVLGYTGGDMLFVPPVMPGRSGSAILDADGTKIVGLLWGTSTEHGVAIGIDKLRSKMHEQTKAVVASNAFKPAAAVVNQPAANFCRPGSDCPECDRLRQKQQQPPTAGPAWPAMPAPSPAPKTDLAPVISELEAIRSEVASAKAPPAPPAADPETARAIGQIGALAADAKKEADELGKKVDGVAKDVGDVKQVIAPLAKLHEKFEADKEAGGLKGKIAGDLQNVLEGNADPKLRLVLITGCVLAAVAGLVFFVVRHHNLTSAIRQKIDTDAKTNPQLQPMADFLDRLDDRLNKAAAGGLPAGLPISVPGMLPGLPVAGSIPAAGVAELIAKMIDQRLTPAPGQSTQPAQPAAPVAVNVHPAG
jgi:hypothetical protein